MFSNRLYTPLRYPGGKAKFAPFISRLMTINDLAGGEYLEPYAGGAGVALDLLFSGLASSIHINDADPAIYDFWASITSQPEAILRLLRDTPVNMAQWHHWRDVLNGRIEADQVERGFATLFLNRTNRSGILKGGVIGGKAQDGTYALDSRFKKYVLASRIQRIADRASDINVYNEDALLLLKRCKSFLPNRSLIYLDPPYYVKGQGLYRNFYVHDDHERIAKLLQSKIFNRRWVLSYDNVEQIKDMYRFNQSIDYRLNYTAQSRYVGSEVMFFDSRLDVPDDMIPQATAAA